MHTIVYAYARTCILHKEHLQFKVCNYQSTVYTDFIDRVFLRAIGWIGEGRGEIFVSEEVHRR